jgi:hypothetical protein
VGEKLTGRKATTSEEEGVAWERGRGATWRDVREQEMIKMPKPVQSCP